MNVLESIAVKVNDQCDWLPPDLMAEVRKKRRLKYVGTFSKAEKQIMRKRRRIRPSTWAEKYRIVTYGKMPGPWRNEVTPYLPGIMDAMALPYVRTIILAAVNQIGKSECVHNFVGWCIDQSPGPVQYNYPDRFTAAESCKDRVLPMIESSARLREYLTGYEDDKTSMKIKLLHMPIYFGWAGSSSRMATRPIKIMIFDETDLYPEKPSKRETDPISQGEKRTITFQHDHKIIKISKPTIENAPISKALVGIPGKIPPEAQVIFDFWVECPGCEKLHLMDFDQIKWEKELDEDGQEQHPNPERLEAQNLAWYECPLCGMKWDDHIRNQAARAGQWRTREQTEWDKVSGGIEMFKYLATERPRKIGFTLPSWISSFRSLSVVAAAKVRALKDGSKWQDFFNAHKAEAFKPKRSARKEDDILALRDDRDRGVAPSEPIIGLTAVVDTQDDGFWYEIRAWGPYPDQESWQVRDGFAISVHSRDFAALEKILFHEVYKDFNGVVYPVQLVWIDTAGHRTGEVYDWCRKHYPRVWGLRGHERMASAWKWDKPGEKHRKKGRDIKLYGLNVNHYKDMLANRLKISPADPGAWHLHRETTFDWAKQMCSEVYNEDKNIWEVINNRANHAWDLSGYHMAMADLVLRNWPLTSEQKKKRSDGAKPGKVARSKFMS